MLLLLFLVSTFIRFVWLQLKNNASNADSVLSNYNSIHNTYTAQEIEKMGWGGGEKKTKKKTTENKSNITKLNDANTKHERGNKIRKMVI